MFFLFICKLFIYLNEIIIVFFQSLFVITILSKTLNLSYIEKLILILDYLFKTFMCRNEYVIRFWMHALDYLIELTTQDCLCDNSACFSPCGSPLEDSEDLEWMFQQQGGEPYLYFSQIHMIKQHRNIILNWLMVSIFSLYILTFFNHRDSSHFTDHWLDIVIQIIQYLPIVPYTKK